MEDPRLVPALEHPPLHLRGLVTGAGLQRAHPVGRHRSRPLTFLAQPAWVTQGRSVTEQHEARLERGQRLTERQFSAGSEGQEPLRLTQTAYARQDVHVVEHVADHQHPVRLAPVGRAPPSGLAREAPEARHLVALREGPVDPPSGLSLTRSKRCATWVGLALPDRAPAARPRRRRPRPPSKGSSASQTSLLAPWWSGCA